MTSVKVSIAIVSYNNEKYLRSCIESALNQTESNIEVVLVDDNSTDHSYQIACEYKDQIRLYRNERNLGECGNTNRCVELCTGEYITILHSDDELLPTFAETLSLVLDTYPKADMVSGEREEIDEEGNVFTLAPFYDDSYLIPGELQAKVFMFTTFVFCQCMYRSSAIKHQGSLREFANPDGLLGFTICLNSDSFAYVQKVVARYRVHSETATKKLFVQSMFGVNGLYRTHCEMVRRAGEHTYLSQFYDQAQKRIGQIAVRYCSDAVETNNRDFLMRYLHLALSFDLTLEEDELFISILESVKQTEIEPHDYFIKSKGSKSTGYSSGRNFSYAPPKESVKLSIPSTSTQLKHII